MVTTWKKFRGKHLSKRWEWITFQFQGASQVILRETFYMEDAGISQILQNTCFPVSTGSLQSKQSPFMETIQKLVFPECSNSERICAKTMKKETVPPEYFYSLLLFSAIFNEYGRKIFLSKGCVFFTWLLPIVFTLNYVDSRGKTFLAPNCSTYLP